MVEVLKTVQQAATCGAVCKACFPVWASVALVGAAFYAREIGPLGGLIDEQLQGWWLRTLHQRQGDQIVLFSALHISKLSGGVWEKNY